MSDLGWRPTDDARRASNALRFARAHGLGSFEELRSRSISDPAWFWDAAVEFLGVRFRSPYDEVLDTSDGVAWARWFCGGELNLAETCIDRWADDSHAADRPAVIWEAEEGSVRTVSYAELRVMTDRIAAGLAARGIGVGDSVGIFMPMLPETVASVLAVAKLGAIFLPIFSGYGAEAVRVRLEDGDARALICADGFPRRGRVVEMKELADAAVEGLKRFDTVVVVPRLGRDVPMRTDRDVTLDDLVAGHDAPFTAVAVDSEHPLLIAYTSGTTGRPKGSVHVQGGFLVKIAAEVAFQTDLHAAERLFWLTDIGWIMGPWEIVGTLAMGGTLVLYDGAPDFPTPDRLWELVERHQVAALGVSPTLVRALMAEGEDRPSRHDLSSLRILASTGEPWNERPWQWFFGTVGGGRCPVINISGGTEVGACFLSAHSVEPIAPCSLGGPALGMAVDVFDDAGNPLRGAVGELVCTKPWPGMTRGLWRDPDRYIETYWSRYPDVWWHGDFASIGDDGQWYLHGRSDDTIKIAGKRLGPSEVETALVADRRVVEAAAVGVPDDLKGEALWCYVVLAPETSPDERLREDLSARVVDALGASFRPRELRFTSALPKTRSAKVLRRAIRALATGDDPGDLSGLEDPGALDAISTAR